MTVVVAVACEDGTVVMGGDSFAGDDHCLDLCVEDKVYTIGPVGVGICGMIRSEQVLARTLRELIPEKKNITSSWLREELADALRTSMKEAGIMEDKEGIHSMKDSSYLLCFNGTIYRLEDDFSLWESRRYVGAIGIGKQYALGALSALLQEGKPTVEEARKAVEAALEVSETWSPWVSGPFKVMEVSSNE